MTARIRNILLFISLFSIAIAEAEAVGVRKIVHADGSIEFTNVTPRAKKKNVVYTNHQSDTASTIYKYNDKHGVVAFSDRKPKGRPYQVLRFDCYACNPDSKIDWNSTGLNLSAYAGIINKAARDKGLDPALVRALIHAESGFKRTAISSQGAQGLMQLMPATARELGVRDAMDARQNINGGTKYMAKLLKQFKGDIRLASAAYNAGPGAVKKYAGVPPYKETRTYVKRVGILHKRYQAALKR